MRWSTELYRANLIYPKINLWIRVWIGVEIDSISTSRFVFPQTGAWKGNVRQASVCVRPSINARSLVCTQNSRGSLYRNNGEGKFVRLQRKEGFARDHDTPRGAALIHANTSDRERERESTVFVFVSWAWRLRDPKLFRHDESRYFVDPTWQRLPRRATLVASIPSRGREKIFSL